MDENWKSWIPRDQFDWQSPNSNCLGAPLNVEHLPTIPSLMNPDSETATIKGILPGYPSLQPPHSRVSQANGPQGWFYCLPRYCQSLAPFLNTGLKEKVPIASHHNNEAIMPKLESGCAQKKFLVFDQSGDQTTLIFSSGIGPTVPCFTSWGPKPIGACNLKREDPGTKQNLNVPFGAIAADRFGENDGTDLQSAMHEDTDELNALLYSDEDSDYTEDDEVTSTGHSPSTMTAQNNQDWFNGSTEEVASSDGSTKKRKSSALMDTASSVKPSSRCFEYEHDAESRCDNGLDWASGGLSKKKMRKERIRDTVSILQTIIPGGKGKDANVVLEEAINYLKSLKSKAKALGLAAL